MVPEVITVLVMKKFYGVTAMCDQDNRAEDQNNSRIAFIMRMKDKELVAEEKRCKKVCSKCNQVLLTSGRCGNIFCF